MQSQFKLLDNALTCYQALWRISPFQDSYVGEQLWQSRYPELWSWLAQLSLTSIQQYKQSTPQLLSDISTIFPHIVSIHELCRLDTSELAELPSIRGLDIGVPGRKLSQINALGTYALSHQAGDEWLEWCAGKGYLGRMLASHSGSPVQSFEWQQSLCCQGQNDADALNLPIQFIQGDAFSLEAKQLLHKNQHAVALHACGDLHVRLLQYATQAGSRAITISPCCYHLIQTPQYQALSEQGQASPLVFNQSDLRIAVQETVTGGQRVIQHRMTEMSYRLGLDCLLKEVLKQPNYQPIPSIKKSQLALGFEHFCAWAAQKKQLELPVLDYDYWYQRGVARFWEMERISLIQQLFLRPIELWLVLDRALFLQQQGYRVSLSEFCPRHITPRNILIHAQRSEGK